MSFRERTQANWILAQHAMSEILPKYGSEERCQSFILSAIAQRKTITCRHCGRENTIPDVITRKFLCVKCKKEVSLTSKTFFHGVQKFLPRVVILELIARGIVLNPNQIAILLKVSNDLVNRCFQKLGLGVSALMMENAVEILSEFCQPAVGRRTRQTPARQPASAEEIELQKIHRSSTNVGEKFSADLLESELSEKEKSIFQMLSAKPISFDKLCEQPKVTPGEVSAILMTLQLQGLVEPHPGNKYAIAKNFLLTNSMTISCSIEKQQMLAKTFVFFVKDHYQCNGRKNHQIYSALHWLYTDRTRWTFDNLLEFCVSCQYISTQEILDYVTPLSFYVTSGLNSS